MIKSLAWHHVPMIFLLFILSIFNGVAQDQPFRDEIQIFIKQDSVEMPPKDAVLFVGSSSIRLWDDLAASFPKYQVINRGFGGSTLKDLLRYLDAIVLPYQARQIFIYSGENDIASDSITAETTLLRLIAVIKEIRKAQPDVSIVFISIKPSPSRIEYLAEMQKANSLIKNYLVDMRDVLFADVFHPMLDDAGKPKPDIFIKDELHLNEKGYKIWQKILEPYLQKPH